MGRMYMRRVASARLVGDNLGRVTSARRRFAKCPECGIGFAWEAGPAPAVRCFICDAGPLQPTNRTDLRHQLVLSLDGRAAGDSPTYETSELVDALLNERVSPSTLRAWIIAARTKGRY